MDFTPVKYPITEKFLIRPGAQKAINLWRIFYIQFQIVSNLFLEILVSNGFLGTSELSEFLIITIVIFIFIWERSVVSRML